MANGLKQKLQEPFRLNGLNKYAATYKELIAKTVAEPISMRCRQAWARWLEKGGDDSIMTKEYILGQIL